MRRHAVESKRLDIGRRLRLAPDLSGCVGVGRQCKQRLFGCRDIGRRIGATGRLQAIEPYLGGNLFRGQGGDPGGDRLGRRCEDVLARRTRALFLNARAAIGMAPRVAELLAQELGRDTNWQQQQLADFAQLAAGYLVPNPPKG